MERVNASPPQRKVFREEIRSAIRDAIFEGELRPGDKIIETFWARELGVSQGPVREAIRDLEAQGLDETWLRESLQKAGLASYREAFLLTRDETGRVACVKKEGPA